MADSSIRADSALRKCTVDGCENHISRKNMCWSHYLRLRRYGDHLAGGVFLSRKRTLEEKIEWISEHKDYDGEDCLIWPFSRRGDGYPVIPQKQETHSAHRAMLIAAQGSPHSPNLDAAHSCGNGRLGCVNPKHLRWATKKENSADRIIHGTDSRGEKNISAIIGNREALEIANKISLGVKGNVLAAEYGISTVAISDIKTGKKWSWLTGIKTKPKIVNF